MDNNQFKSPILTVDIVLFTIIDKELNILLSKRDSGSKVFSGDFSLPGGFVHTNEDVNLVNSAIRVLKEKIDFRHSIYLEQLEAFSGVNRDPRGWSVSIAFCAIIPFSEVSTNENVKWVSISEVSGLNLPFDHNEIIEKAVLRIRNKSSYSILPIYFFKDKFTLSELQKVYEVILQQKLDKSSFRKRIEDLGVLTLLEGEYKLGSQRPAQLYTINNVKTPWFKSNLN